MTIAYGYIAYKAAANLGGRRSAGTSSRYGRTVSRHLLGSQIDCQWYEEGPSTALEKD